MVIIHGETYIHNGYCIVLHCINALQRPACTEGVQQYMYVLQPKIYYTPQLTCVVDWLCKKKQALPLVD